MNMFIADLNNPRFCNSKGWYYYKERNYELAEELFDKAISLDGTTYQYHANKSFIRRDLGDFEGAHQCLDNAKKIAPVEAHRTIDVYNEHLISAENNAQTASNSGHAEDYRKQPQTEIKNIDEILAQTDSPRNAVSKLENQRKGSDDKGCSIM